MSETKIQGLTRGGAPWIPEFVMALDAKKCIGCGRCYKVCPRDVFTLVDRSEVLADDDLDDDDDELKVMTLKDALDCIGCMSCSRVCPKQCHSHAAMPA
ncbi:MAG: ferredoxin III, nif-specific [Pseudomonadales bacterium]|nr:ferredoxin III, nif-specific [Pseudomonadales bacterium]